MKGKFISCQGPLWDQYLKQSFDRAKEEISLTFSEAKQGLILCLICKSKHHYDLSCPQENK